jgi:hypothetical protein
MAFGVAHWDTLDNILAFSMQGEDIFECIDGKGHLCTL